jgi:hypothetical protein
MNDCTMNRTSRFFLQIVCMSCMLTFCHVKANAQLTQEQFWSNLQQLCGKTFEGTVMAAPPK